jgi:gliding motility-associated-like protein
MTNSLRNIFTKSLVLVFIFCAFQANAQSYNVPSSGNNTITACSGTVYDPGGTSSYSNSCNGYLVINPGQSGCVVHLSGTYDTESNYDKIYIYEGVGVNGQELCMLTGSGSVDVISSTGSLTVKFTSDGTVTYSGFVFQVSCTGGCSCGGSPYNIATHGITGGVNIQWAASLDPSVHAYILEYGPVGFTPGTGTSTIVNSNSYNILGLTPGETYEIHLYYDCGNDGIVTTETPKVFSFCMPENTSCIDFSSWSNPNITCTYGSYSNPYQTVGVVDNGSSVATSRHTVYFSDELDPRTGNLLHVIPPCELYSVRLGNWNTGSQAESISYNFHVDTNENAILLLKYAAVLQNPSHNASQQPRFKFELLNQNNQLIDPTCGAADYIANTNLGWNTAGSNVLWKDWTFVGTDLSNYHGQNIKVRLTTYDCDQGAHYGYAYFTLNCNKKNITVESCGAIAASTYTAPAGFSYQWYYENTPNNILSTNQSITIQGGSGNLFCRVISLNNPNCYFVLHTSLEPRYPLARFTADRDSCTFSYHFINNSVVSGDGVSPLPTNEPCQSAHWNFGDGTTSDEVNPVHEYPGPGTYNIVLLAGLNQDECLDTAFLQIVIPPNSPEITGDFDICGGESTTLHASGGHSYTWAIGDSLIGQGDQTTVQLQESAIITLHSYGEDNCVKNLDQEVVVHPSYYVTFHDTICQYDTYLDHGFTLPISSAFGDFAYNNLLHTYYGCDSLLTLKLHVTPLPLITISNPDHCFRFGDPLELRVQQTYDDYLWSTGATTQSVLVYEDGLYSVTVSQNNCENTQDVNVMEVCPFNVFIPNSFSPSDGNGINDYFSISGSEDMYNFMINIYDRFGNTVYRSTDKDFQWDGRVNGKLYTNCTYNYLIQCTDKLGEKFEFKGSILVL